MGRKAEASIEFHPVEHSAATVLQAEKMDKENGRSTRRKSEETQSFFKL